MKIIKLYILIILFPSALIAQCPPGPTIFTTQAQINSFATNFPDCTVLQGNSTISGSTITDLTPLNQLTGFDGTFRIEENTNLTTLEGLENVTNIAGTLVIEDNFMLSSILALQNTIVNNGVIIESNFNLESLDGLQSVVNTFGSVSIIDNPELQNLNGLNNLESALHLYIEDNEGLSSLLGIESFITAENEIRILGNNLLTSLDGLDNLLNALSIQIAANNNLSECSINSLCAIIDANGILVTIANNAIGCNSMEEVVENCAMAFNNISGYVRYDIDDDDCDGEDTPVSGATLAISDGIETFTTITDSEGFYNIAVGSGSWTLSLVQESLPPYYTILANDFLFEYNEIGNTDQQDFCINNTQEVNDVSINITSINPPRPGFESNYNLYLQNLGTTVQEGNFTFSYDNERISFLTSEEAPIANTENSLTFSYQDLMPFEARPFEINFISFVPPINNDQDLLNSQAEITASSEDDSADNNIYNLQEVFVNSYDPNDKLVFQGVTISPEEVGDYLDYRIRFQNTGSADAINVEITDELSNNLNWETLRVLDASHDYEVFTTQDNLVHFLFEDINLPPQEVDEDESNGYIIFQIRSNNNLELDNTIENTANIFFDFNEAIITNTVVTTVSESLSLDELNNQLVTIFPNPSKGIVYIKAPIETINSLSLYSVLGKKVKNISKNSFDGTINISLLENGIYFLRLNIEDKAIIKKIIKM